MSPHPNKTRLRRRFDAPWKGKLDLDDKPEVAPTPTPVAAPTAVETRGEHFRRKARRTRLHLYAFFTVALVVCLVALAVANTRQVKLSWVVGSSAVSLVWIVLSSAILGWLLGIVTSALFRWRTRSRRG